MRLKPTWISKKKGPVWNKFGLTKLSNACFYLEYVVPDLCDDSHVGEIDLDDIRIELKY